MVCGRLKKPLSDEHVLADYLLTLITEDHSKEDQILFVEIIKHIGFSVCAVGPTYYGSP